MIIKFSPAFFNNLKKVDVRIKKSTKERINLFAKNPLDLKLNNHPLRRKYEGYKSIDITADYRALYLEKVESEQKVAYFVLLGTHKELYG